MTVLEITREASRQRRAIETFAEHAAWSPDGGLLLEPEGREHYRLLSHIAATMAEGKDELVVADVGTFKGFSAIALASGGPEVRVTSYDIVDCLPAAPTPSARTLPNVTCKLQNCLEDPQALADVARSDLVCLDIDPHDGVKERRFVDLLAAAGFRGVLFCDDIHLGDGMTRFWTSVTQRKYDVSAAAHWSGSGIVVFDPSLHQVRGCDAILTV